MESVVEQGGENLRVCRRCLTRDMAGQEEYFQTMHDYIKNMDIDIKTPESLYEERLSSCKECEMLFQGMCRRCGCYVELRAAVKKNVCPDKRW